MHLLTLLLVLMFALVIAYFCYSVLFLRRALGREPL